MKDPSLPPNTAPPVHHLLPAPSAIALVRCAVNSEWAEYISTAAALLQEAGDERVFSILFPFPGHYDHPHAPENRYMADALLELIESHKLACRGGNLSKCTSACANPLDFERCASYCSLRC